MGSIFFALTCLGVVSAHLLAFGREHFTSGGRRSRIFGRMVYTVILTTRLAVIAISATEARNVWVYLDRSTRLPPERWHILSIVRALEIFLSMRAHV